METENSSQNTDVINKRYIEVVAVVTLLVTCVHAGYPKQQLNSYVTIRPSRIDLWFVEGGARA